MERVDYNQRQYDVYAKGRAISPERMARLVGVLAVHLPDRRPLVIADVGCGVGRFTPALANAFGGPVYGIEPAARMREQAKVLAPHPMVRYLDGRAEAIPLQDASCEAALCWFVWHHIEDRGAAAAELARVVAHNGTLLLRTNAADRLPALWWFAHFPKAAEVEARASGTLAQIMAPLEAAGWHLESLATVLTESTFGSDLAMLRLRAISNFEHLDEDEIESGLASAEQAVRGREDEVVATAGDLLVWRKSGAQ